MRFIFVLLGLCGASIAQAQVPNVGGMGVPNGGPASSIIAGTTICASCATGNFLSSTTNKVVDSGVAVTNVALLGSANSFTAAQTIAPASGAAAFTLNDLMGSQQAVILFDDAGTLKYYLGKQTDNSFFIINQVTGAAFVNDTAVGVTTFGDVGSTAIVSNGHTGLLVSTVGNATIGGSLTITTLSTATGSFLCETAGLVSIEATTCVVSDASAKNDPAPIDDDDLLSHVLAQRGVRFTYKLGMGAAGRRIGVIANDWEQNFPELVDTDPNGLRHFDYAATWGLTVELIRRLKTDFDTYRAAHP